MVAITPGWRTSKTKRHVVKHIIAPGSGTAIADRPPIPTWEELHAEAEAKRSEKLDRRALKLAVAKAETKYEMVRRNAVAIGKQLAQQTRIIQERAAARLARAQKEGGEV